MSQSSEHSERLAWWEWPFVILMAPFVWLWNAVTLTLRAVGRTVWKVLRVIGKPLGWAVNTLVFRPVAWMYGIFDRGVRKIAYIIGIPVRTVYAYIRSGLSTLWGYFLWAVSPPLGFAWSCLKRVGLALRMMGSLIAKVARSMKAPLTWAERQIGRVCRGLWYGLLRPVGRTLAWPMRMVFHGIEWIITRLWRGGVFAAQYTRRFVGTPARYIAGKMRKVVTPVRAFSQRISARARHIWTVFRSRRQR